MLNQVNYFLTPKIFKKYSPNRKLIFQLAKHKLAAPNLRTVRLDRAVLFAFVAVVHLDMAQQCDAVVLEWAVEQPEKVDECTSRS